MNHVESEGYALRWLTGSVYVVSRREEEERIWCEFFWRIVSSLETKPTSQDRESTILLNEYLSTLEADIKVNMVYILSPFRDPLHRDRVVFIQNRYCYAIYRILCKSLRDTISHAVHFSYFQYEAHVQFNYYNHHNHVSQLR